MKNILVADVMTREPVTARSDETLFNCAKKMVRRKVGSLLLIDGKKLAGFISQKDILWALIKKSNIDLSKIKAIDISPKKIAVIKPTATVQEAIGKMQKFQFERLPVVDNGNLVGMVTVKDVLSFHPNIYPELEEFIQIREEQEKLKRIKKKDLAVIEDGICEECGKRASLYRVHGMLICDSCRSSI
ncbi:CBS domain-containing protein [Candidatus Pacearchaeota archaeon]|nr:CBS domain-containing protein [Candidatus Pacearchaeota archaeon]